ncbi:MAG: magnetosome biogenesis CDF transporter MamB [Alphaproteobacteria bacterium]|nr:magnetosome biogenesis CDF transporter MamB [Alphaproteobacteria bacterium]MBF0250901.1 magnetosome biogenesis CDF transporter MamB [Alphaproteobacteria bacterium]
MKSPRCRKCREEVIWWAFFVNIAQTGYKGLLGVLSGSAALVADSMHSGADVVASAVTMASVKLSGRPADDDYPYGYGNVQFISSSIVGLILIFGALYLIYESISKIVAGDIAAPSAMAVFGAGISIVTNELMYRYQNCVGTENNSPAIIANAWDNRSDAMSSLAVLVGIAAAVMGFPIADNLAAIGVGFMVAKIGIELNVDAIDGLMDSSVDTDVLTEVYDIAKGMPQVLDVHYLRGRNVGEDVHLDISICVDGELKVYESDFISDAVRNRIYSNVDHVTDVQVSVIPVRQEVKTRNWRRLPKFVKQATESD